MHKILSIFNSKKCPTAFLICLALLIIVEVIVRSNLYYLTTHSDALIHYKEKILRKRDKKISPNAILMGDSRILGLHAKEISDNLINLNYSFYNYALPNHGVRGYYLLLKKYLKYNPAPEVILFYSSPIALTKAWNLDNVDKIDKKKLFRFVSLYSLIDSFEILPLKIFYKALMLKIEKISNLVTYRKKIRKLFANRSDFKDKSSWLKSSLEISSGGAIICQNKEPTMKDVVTSEYYQTHFKLNSDSLYWFDQFFKLAQDNAIEIIISNAPLVKPTFKKREENGNNQKYIKQMKNFEKKFENITLIEPLLEGWNLSYFCDTQHLNKEGLKLFTEESSNKISKSLQNLVK